jgi:hypothetical protein
MEHTMSGGPGGELLQTILQQLAEQAEAIAGLQAKVPAQDGKPGAGNEDKEDGYQPRPAPRWWLRGDPVLTGEQQEELAEALTFLQGWVKDIYRPMYGHLAETLPACWDRHPLCLMTMDWLAELWSVLYLQPSRASLTMQADFQTRLLPAAAEQMARECEDCGHQAVRPA